MTEDPGTINLDSEKLGRLLRLYVDSDETDEGSPLEDKKAMLTDLLSDPLPVDNETISAPPTMLKKLYEEMPPLLRVRLFSTTVR